MLLKIAWRNVWRARTRSLIVISSIMVGVWAVLAGTGFMNGFLVSYMSETINHDVSNIQIHHRQLSYQLMDLVQAQFFRTVIIIGNKTKIGIFTRHLRNKHIAGTRLRRCNHLVGVQTTNNDETCQ